MAIRKQVSLFDKDVSQEGVKYTPKIEAPIYEPKNIKPTIWELCDSKKTSLLVKKINESNVSEDEKQFLSLAAQRHIVFNYEKIADYYAHASKEMQQLMEESALVIIDFEKAIEHGYVKLCDDIRNQYLTEYEKQ